MAKRAPTPSPNRGHIPLPPAKQVALIVGRHGIGEEIALSFVKRGIKIAITYVSHEDEARKASDRIKSRVSHQSYVIGVRQGAGCSPYRFLEIRRWKDSSSTQGKTKLPNL
jgi:hypothetical protein